MHTSDTDDDKRGPFGATVIVGFNYWGAAEDLDTAKANFKNAGGRLSDGYVIYVFDQNTSFEGVDMMGGVNYRGNAPAHKQMVYGKLLKRTTAKPTPRTGRTSA